MTTERTAKQASTTTNHGDTPSSAVYGCVPFVAKSVVNALAVTLGPGAPVVTVTGVLVDARVVGAEWPVPVVSVSGR